MEAPGTSNNSISTKRRILVLGREQSASEATVRYLEYSGHQVSLAEDPKSAMLKADGIHPQVLICDLNPDSSYDRVRAARHIQERHESAIVVITNHFCWCVRDRFPELRVTQCLRKPVSLWHLAQSVAGAGSRPGGKNTLDH
jgi:DNA-binding NtrC family response regulator